MIRPVEVVLDLMWCMFCL